MDLHVRILRELKDLASSGQGRRLPSLRTLAARWNTSLTTVQKAVKAGTEAGWLETRPGSGVWPAGSRPTPVPPPNRWDAQKLAEAISREIEEGKFGPGQKLPTPKSYSIRFGIHPSTARKALALLTSRGMIEREGRSWRTSPPPRRRSSRKSVVWCFGAADEEGRLRMDSDREWDFWREIQIEAIRCGLHPELRTWNGELPDFQEEVLGAVVSTWHMADTQPVLDALLRQRIPTAVWVANDEVLPGSRYRAVQGMWFHDLGYGMVSGETMAQYLRGLEVRKVAWVSPFHSNAWSRNRLLGLRIGLGPEAEVVEATGGWVSEWDVMVQVMADPAVRGRLDLRGLEGMDPEHPSDRIRRPLDEAVTRLRCMEEFAPRLEDLLESGPSVWVAAADLTAHWCHRWLRDHASPRAKEISIVGFDDTREASRLGWTSLRFDVQGMVRAMLGQILSSRRPHRLVTRHTGHVVERGSTARTRGGRDGILAEA